MAGPDPTRPAMGGPGGWESAGRMGVLMMSRRNLSSRTADRGSDKEAGGACTTSSVSARFRAARRRGCAQRMNLGMAAAGYASSGRFLRDQVDVGHCYRKGCSDGGPSYSISGPRSCDFCLRWQEPAQFPGRDWLAACARGIPRVGNSAARAKNARRATRRKPSPRDN